MDSKKVCVVGAGYWGTNHIRTLDKMNALGGIVESNSEKLKPLSEQYPDMNLYLSRYNYHLVRYNYRKL